MLILIQRKWVPFAFALVLLVVNSISSANLRAQDATIVVLKSQDAGPYDEALTGFKDCLKKQGLKPDFHVLSLKGDAAKVSSTVKKVSEQKPNLIFALGALASKTASEKITDVPIVSGMVLRSDAILEAANVEAVFLDYSIETQLSWLKRIIPEAKTIGVLYNPEDNQEQVDKAAVIARQMKLNFLPQRVNNPKEIPQALDTLSRKADVLWGLPDKMVFTSQTAKQILLFSFRHRIPFVGLSSSWVKAGALYALDWDYREEGRECGATALRILKYKKMDEISPGMKNSVKYSLNLKTAERMKIDVPETLVKQAKNVY